MLSFVLFVDIFNRYSYSNIQQAIRKYITVYLILPWDEGEHITKEAKHQTTWTRLTFEVMTIT
jgi:hypothetical protein